MFHEEVGLAADFQANPDVVAQIDEFRHPSREAVDAGLAGAIEAHAFRANRQRDGFAGLADIDGQGFNLFTATEFDDAAVAGLAVQAAIETVVLADEVGDEGVFRLFVEGARRRRSAGSRPG